MAGGKETPRQKMIGMMYLVLTALLALNVSKQIVAAFITLNDKIDASTLSLDGRIETTYSVFDNKGATLRATGGDMSEFNLWYSKAEELKNHTAELVGYLLGECNEMIQTAEGSDWVETRDAQGNITKLKSLSTVQNMDNYDIPTNMFVGGNPNQPNDRGMEIRKRIHDFRDQVASSMGTYSLNGKKWEFTPPQNLSELDESLKKCNPEDTVFISQFYRSLTLPEFLHSHGEEKDLPWVSVMFDHAPIVAAAALFTSLKLDVKNGHAFASEYMLSKIDVIPFKFNKIDPMPFAPTAYINMGDSINLNVMIAAYDTTEIYQLRYGMDADTANRSAWKESTGPLSLAGNSPGVHKLMGEIGVRERGEIKWKPWEFQYTVGQPMGVVAQPEMRVLYWGYKNVVEGTASGYPPERISLSANGCTLTSAGNGKFYANVNRGTRNASISVIGTNDDGSKTNLGTYNFVCKPMPKGELYFGSASNGQSLSYTEARNTGKVRVTLPSESTLTNVTYTIVSGEVRGDMPGTGKILSGGNFDTASKNIIAQSRGKTVYIDVTVSDQSGVTAIISGKFKIN